MPRLSNKDRAAQITSAHTSFSERIIEELDNAGLLAPEPEPAYQWGSPGFGNTHELFHRSSKLVFLCSTYYLTPSQRQAVLDALNDLATP